MLDREALNRITLELLATLLPRTIIALFLSFLSLSFRAYWRCHAPISEIAQISIFTVSEQAGFQIDWRERDKAYAMANV